MFTCSSRRRGRCGPLDRREAPPPRPRSRWRSACLTALAVAGLIPGFAPPAQAGDKRIEMHLWGCNLGDPRWGWYALVREYERRHPNVRVVIGPQDRGSDLQKLLSGIVGNAPPDLFLREGPLFGDIAARGILYPMDGFVQADKARPDGLHEKDFIPGKWSSGKYQGKLYGIGAGAGPLMMAYNKDLFRKAGLDPERPPRTWDEWVEATRKLTICDSSGRTVQLGSMVSQYDDMGFYIIQQGGRLFSDDGRRCLVNSPEGLKAARLLKRLYDAQGGRAAVDRFMASTSAPEEYNPFAMGKVAMVVQDDWVILRVMRFAPHMKLGLAPLPTPDGRNPITVDNAGSMYMIPVNARQKQAAWDFLRFAVSPEGEMLKATATFENARKRGQVHEYPGFRPNIWASAALAKRYAPRRSPFKEAFAKAQDICLNMVPIPANPVSGFLRDEITRATARIAYGQMTPEAAMADTARRVQEQLDLIHERETLPIFDWKWAWGSLLAVIAIGVGTLVIRSRREAAPNVLGRRETLMGLLFISPWMLGLLLFVAGPMVFSVAISFCDYNVISPPRFVGLRNYMWLLTRDPLMWKSLSNTAFMVFAVPLGMATSLSIAMLLNTRVKGMSVYRTLFYLPAVTPMVAAAVLWYALLNPSGLINNALNATVCEWFKFQPPAWLQDPAWSKPAIIMMGMWGAGGGMILWLAGLQGVPRQLYESASIDGASSVRQFLSITLPMLTPYILYSLIIGVIGVFQMFAQALVLTEGGPSDSTLFYVYYLFNNAFRYFKMGYASAQAWILFLIVLVLTMAQWRVSKRWVHYG